MSRPTIYDVAREAGVAASTVSRAYARPGRVNADTAQRIFEAAEKLGYRSGIAARRPGPPVVRNAIALVVADVTNPFYGDIIKGAYEAAREAGYQLILSHTNESPKVERQTIEQELAQVDGVVIASSRMTDSALRMVAKQKAVVLLNRIIPEANCVLNDAERGIRRAVEHLAALGHERITYVAGPETSWSDGVRWRALRQSAAELGLEARRLGPNEPTVLAGIGAALRVAETDSTAVQAYNDQLAIGIVKGLSRLGVAVPEQVSVIGFDNIIFDELVEPQLTTIASPLYRMGFTGMQNCIAVAQGARTTGRPLVLPVRLVVRKSTAARPAVPRPRPARDGRPR
ncbi:LacI family DNA-binding transcriptional regulator [Paractinoplanes brasiliensis]|uniref:LacI family transcriptional regulator n=1 Tax=Paractinoplanes brasiliensis TaxID=52695 RepID=A0A4R6JA22_9ACTN|nr:LacI family DNA-binding transcriptional regulator [Actinoplanes brasiliensis]TDO32500.1 LacI family transcriptional regulator [Actinoplanes brasiliensis]GID27624.1 LacI family transcriptional regulator [Actinoplanes brasiliensis]